MAASAAGAEDARAAAVAEADARAAAVVAGNDAIVTNILEEAEP
jgi:hypothetical protein